MPRDVRSCRNCHLITSINRPLSPGRAQIRDSLRFRRNVEALHSLGCRPLGEFLLELGRHHAIGDDIGERLELWHDRLTPELVRAVGADRWPAPFAMLRGGRR